MSQFSRTAQSQASGGSHGRSADFACTADTKWKLHELQIRFALYGPPDLTFMDGQVLIDLPEKFTPRINRFPFEDNSRLNIGVLAE